MQWQHQWRTAPNDNVDIILCAVSQKLDPKKVGKEHWAMDFALLATKTRRVPTLAVRNLCDKTAVDGRHRDTAPSMLQILRMPMLLSGPCVNTIMTSAVDI